ncbi:GTPase [Maribacter hydrothermalis]|uniref:GTPase n=1 Tax=Maribacter hydrothermalis TaxID=1836467 RepID=A0A1B7ZE03_9FLAO|nr:GTPase [Maribacter hydrothermalis]APQ16572.1 GTPase [Maribacter hydrothermalis]OBR41523.1 GTPase [Maribacter hydrothermalis]
MSKKILFIYNANSDTSSKMLDFAHKIVSPATYNCKLCSLTFGNFTENKQWKTFRESLLAKGYELEFYHKDEFQKTYKGKFVHKYTYPIILVETEHDLEVLVSTDQLNAMETVEELISSVGSFSR